jgi:hypothetical protein
MLNFPRQIGLKRTRCYNRQEFDDYVKRLNGRSDLYTSLYYFDDPNDYDSVVIDRAWWDFDMNDEYDMEQVKSDVANLIRRLEGDVRLVATGRGFHVHQIFDRPVRGRQWAFHLDRYQRKMCEGLESIDGVGYPEKLCRIPKTYNCKRGRWAVPINSLHFSNDPMGFEIPKSLNGREHLWCPFTGELDSHRFDLVRWNVENPHVEKQETQSVKVGNHEGDVMLPTCLDRAIRLSNPPHHVRVALVQEMARQLRWYAHPSDISHEEKMEIADNICDFISDLDWIDYNPATTSKYVRGMMKYANAPSPIWYKRHNLCQGGCWYCD